MGYKKYIKDYRKEYIVKPNGKPGVTATYIGKYYVFKADERQFRKSRLLFALLSALTVVCCFVPLLFNTEANHTLYVSLPNCISLFPTVHLIFGVFNLFDKKPPLIREFRDKTEGRITTASVTSACTLAVTAVCWVVKCAASGFGALDIVSVLLLAVGSALAGYMFAKRKAFATEERDNPNAESVED